MGILLTGAFPRIIVHAVERQHRKIKLLSRRMLGRSYGVHVQYTEDVVPRSWTLMDLTAQYVPGAKYIMLQSPLGRIRAKGEHGG